MKLLIIRHGDPDYAHDSLTEKGFREADLLGKMLSNEKIDFFYCSPLGRAKRTMEPTLKYKGVDKYEILDWAREMPVGVDVDYRDIGIDFQGRISPWDLCPPFWTVQPEMYDKDKWKNAPVYANSNAEERYDVVEKGIADLLLRHGLVKDGHCYNMTEGYDDKAVIALFCHLGLGNCLISALTGLPLPVIWHSFFLPTTSVTTVLFEHFDCCPTVTIPRIVGLGSTTHLYIGGEPVSNSGLHSKM